MTQGAVNGNPTATNHNGTYSGLGGIGLSYQLGERTIENYPSRDGVFSEGGRVTVRIKVDRQGNIIDYTILPTDNPTIGNLAKKKIKEVKFNASPNAPAVQFGEIVFVFKLQQ